MFALVLEIMRFAFFLFSWDSSSLHDNVCLSVGWSVRRLVGVQQVSTIDKKFEGDYADMCAGKFTLVTMGGRAEGLV